MTVHRAQLPLTVAYAFTDYRAQGQSLKPVIVNIRPPFYGHLTPFSIYTALSRGIDHNNICLLQDFDENLLQQHPSEYLRWKINNFKI
jgi:ATP-dependent exoDNAse (exonuclease V) alpha subunit